MKHTGDLGHFLVYHILPVVLLYGGMLGFIGLLMYFYNKKKRNRKRGEKEPEKIKFPFEAKSARRKRRKK